MPSENCRILDLGCGPGDIIRHLKSSYYIGIDINPRYILDANKRFSGRGEFKVWEYGASPYLSDKSFDIVMANNVLHHLHDLEADSLLSTAICSLKTGGSFFSIDPCFRVGQSKFERFIMSLDRGEHIRFVDNYKELVKNYFTNVSVFVIYNSLRVPFSHIVMKCSN